MENNKNKNINLLIAGLSGFVVKTTTILMKAPFERARIILQTQGAIPNLKSPFTGVLSGVARLYREEGFYSLWRGAFPHIIRTVPVTIFNFGLKDSVKKLFPRYDIKTEYTKFFVSNIAMGAISGGLSLAFVYPLDLIRVRLAADLGKELKYRQFSGLRDCFNKIYQQNGLRGLYKGVAISMAGVVVYRGLYFGLYDSLKPFMPKETISKFIVAYAVTLTAAILTYPFDTTWKRLTMESDKPGGIQVSAISCVNQMIKKEGFRSLFRGLAFNIGSGIASSLALVLYDSFFSKTDH